MRMLAFTMAVLAAALSVSSSYAAKPVVIVAPNDVVWDDDIEVKKPLINVRGKAVRGMEVFIDTVRGNCVACHRNVDVQAMQFLGNVGPELNYVGERYTKSELRAILVDSKRMFGDETVMPGFYVERWGLRTPEKFQNTTILTAQEVEDLIAYLLEMQR